MRSSSKLVALFFLSTFSVFLLHQMLPHIHHEHERTTSIEQVEDHHDNHESNHHHHDDESNDGFDLLDLLLGNHTHSSQLDNIPTVKHLAKQQTVKKDECHFFLYDAQPISPVGFTVPKSNFGNSPPGFFSQHYSSSFFLRGPPSIG